MATCVVKFQTDCTVEMYTEHLGIHKKLSKILKCSCLLLLSAEGVAADKMTAGINVCSCHSTLSLNMHVHKRPLMNRNPITISRGKEKKKRKKKKGVREEKKKKTEYIIPKKCHFWL